MDSFVIALGISLFGLVTCAAIARARHRDPIAWGAAGLFFPLIAIIAVLVVGARDDRGGA